MVSGQWTMLGLKLGFECRMVGRMGSSPRDPHISAAVLVAVVVLGLDLGKGVVV